MRCPVVHLELHTPDLPNACAFVSEVLGWRPQRVDSASQPYVSLDAGLSAGVVACGTPSAVWIPYVEVADVDAATRCALARGARALLTPRDGPHGRRGVVRSPVAGDLAFWEPS